MIVAKYKANRSKSAFRQPGFTWLRDEKLLNRLASL
jgi:hypothetical protein